jgi:hypothetical protein
MWAVAPKCSPVCKQQGPPREITNAQPAGDKEASCNHWKQDKAAASSIKQQHGQPAAAKQKQAAACNSYTACRNNLLLQASYVCQQEERHSLAAVPALAAKQKIPPGLPKLYVSGPQIFNKDGPRSGAGKWAQNLGHTPGCCYKFKQSQCFGHENRARKRAQHRDRVFHKNGTWNCQETQTWTAHP